MKSASKPGGIYLAPCGSSAELMFPLDQHPMSWASCGDAYTHTWASDPDNLLSGLTDLQRTKLSRSSGFCPHVRCQLSEVGNSDSAGHCPVGLCYTKVEAGSPSFGACCFINGSFLAGKIVGYFDKLSPTPKPIYRAHRVLLGQPPGDGDASPSSFFNGHLLADNFLITQCPLNATVADVKRVIVERKVRRWLQIYNPPAPGSALKDCTFLATAFMDSVFGLGVQMESLPAQSPAFVERVFRICYRPGPQPTFMQFDDRGLCNGELHSLRYTGYVGWEDFMVPPVIDWPALMGVAQDFKSHMLRGDMAAVNCLSGRGRSGTFASIVLALVATAPVTTHDQLTDLIVAMRERRDGLVETPNQYVFASRVLGLPDPANPHTLKLQQVESDGRTGLWMALTVLGAALLLGLVLCGVARLKRKTNTYNPVAEDP